MMSEQGVEGSERVLIGLSAVSASAVRCRAEEDRVTLRVVVMRALPRIGIPVAPHLIDGTRSPYSQRGAGRPRKLSGAYVLGLVLPFEIAAALRLRARQARMSMAALVRLALARDGVPIRARELIADRRRGRNRTPRTHYAEGVRGPRAPTPGDSRE